MAIAVSTRCAGSTSTTPARRSEAAALQRSIFAPPRRVPRAGPDRVPSTSLRFDPGRGDDLLPLLHVVRHGCREFVGCARARLRAFAGELIARLGYVQDRIDFAIEPYH